MRDWVTNVATTHYLLGSALGPHPYPLMVRDFHRVIGDEARAQILEREERLPDSVFACVGGGSNAIGMFYAFSRDDGVKLIGVEAGGRGQNSGEHAARFSRRLAGRAAWRLQLSAAGRRRPDCRSPIPSPPASITPWSARSMPGCAISSRAEYVSCTDADALEAAATAVAYRRHHSGARIGPCRRRSHPPRALRQGRDLRRQSLRPRRQRHRHLSRKPEGARRMNADTDQRALRAASRSEDRPRSSPTSPPATRRPAAHRRTGCRARTRRRGSDRTRRAVLRSHRRRARHPARLPSARSKPEPPSPRCSRSPREIRKRSEIPLLLFTYMNPLLRYGLDARARCRRLRHRRLPSDRPQRGRSRPLRRRHAARRPRYRISWPRPPARPSVSAWSPNIPSGFVYLVSRTGVTGERASLSDTVGPAG